MEKKKRLFCEISPTTYAISLFKERLKRHAKNLLGHERYAKEIQTSPLPVLVATGGGDMIKRGPGINPIHQQGKADNIRLAASRIDGLIIHPGETFSFWQRVGKTSRRNGFREGRVIVNGRLVAGTGGGLCNLAHTLNLLVQQSPLTVTELHHHSDALAPDADGVRVPYSAGTSVNYNHIDYRFRNDTAQAFQPRVWCEGDTLRAELRTTAPLPHRYRIAEENHHFHRSESGDFYRISQIYRETLDAQTHAVTHRRLIRDNRSRVMFDPSLIPPHLIA
ncbi:MAG: VanW family protein [Bacteroidaceae bacterium]|nr:VanW family protein [Bacteroidaceae bacterium]